MELERSRKFTVRMGEYEAYGFGATVRMSHADLGVSDEELLAQTDAVRAALRRDLEVLVMSEITRQLLEEIEDSAALTADRKSFVRLLVEPPAQTTKRVRRRARSA